MSYKDKPIVKLYAYENSAFVLKAIIDDYQEISLGYNKYEAGEFTLQINYNIPNALLFETNKFLLVNDVFIVITNVTDSIDEGGKGSQTRVVTGYDARILYKRRIIKSLNNGTTWTMTDKGETVMRALINAQCGTSVETKRQLPITMSTATTLGSDYTVSEAYTNLYDVLVTIATQTEIGWSVDFTGGALVLNFYQGTDKSDTVHFSTEYDSLRNGTFEDSLESFSNAVYVGGKGSSDDKDLYLGEQDISGSAPSGLDRFECYSDAQSMTSDEEYEAEANSMLNQYGQTISISGQGMIKCPYEFGEEYDIGDTVNIGFNGKEADVEVLSLTEHWSWGSYDIEFSFGKPEASLQKQIFSILNKISTTSAETSNSSYDSVKYYTLPDATSMPQADTGYSTIGFTGTLSSNQNFTLYFDSSSKVGAKTYHVYFKNLTGSGKLTITSGVSGKSTLQFNTGTYVAIIYVDSEGNVKTGIGTDDTQTSTSTTWSSTAISEFAGQTAGCTTAAATQLKEITLSDYTGDSLPDNTEFNFTFTYANTYGDTTLSTPTYPKLVVKNASGTTMHTLDVCDSRGHYAGTGCWNAGDLIIFKKVGNKALITNSDVRQTTSDYTIMSDNTFEYGKYSSGELFTGKYWIDGKKIYRYCKKFNDSELVVKDNAWTTVATLPSAIDYVVNWELSLSTQDHPTVSSIYGIMDYTKPGGNNPVARLQVIGANVNFAYNGSISGHSYTFPYNCVLIIEYTKV